MDVIEKMKIDIKNVIPHGRKNQGTMKVTLSVAPDLTVGVEVVRFEQVRSRLVRS
jgi:hypothetical protein